MWRIRHYVQLAGFRAHCRVFWLYPCDHLDLGVPQVVSHHQALCCLKRCSPRQTHTPVHSEAIRYVPAWSGTARWSICDLPDLQSGGVRCSIAHSSETWSVRGEVVSLGSASVTALETALGTASAAKGKGRTCL